MFIYSKRTVMAQVCEKIDLFTIFKFTPIIIKKTIVRGGKMP